MTIRTILACASGGTASDGAIETACRLANQFEAHVEGFHVRGDPIQTLTLTGYGFDVPIAGEVIEQLTKDAQALAEKTKAAFEKTSVQHHLQAPDKSSQKGASASWREETGFPAALVARRARFFDLAVLGRSERVIDEHHTDVVEQTLIHSGRPVLLAPAVVPPTIGHRIAIGWNGSVESVRAITAALPLLDAAKSATIIAVGEKHRDSADSMARYLAWHGIQAEISHLPTSPKAGVGEQILIAAYEQRADLLIVGGYGHAPWREFLFGGATRELVGGSMLPLLLSH